MSTTASLIGVHADPAILETLITRLSGAPDFTEPSDGSTRTSERLSFSSTKYGPSVCSGRTTQAGVAAALAFEPLWNRALTVLTAAAAINPSICRRRHRRCEWIFFGFSLTAKIYHSIPVRETAPNEYVKVGRRDSPGEPVIFVSLYFVLLAKSLGRLTTENTEE